MTELPQNLGDIRGNIAGLADQIYHEFVVPNPYRMPCFTPYDEYLQVLGARIDSSFSAPVVGPPVYAAFRVPPLGAPLRWDLNDPLISRCDAPVIPFPPVSGVRGVSFYLARSVLFIFAIGQRIFVYPPGVRLPLVSLILWMLGPLLGPWFSVVIRLGTNHIRRRLII